MKAKKIFLTILSVVMLFAVTAFAVSCNKKPASDTDNSSASYSSGKAESDASSGSSQAETVSYSVEYYLQNVAGDGYVLYETAKNLTATAGETVSAEIKTFAHFAHVSKTESVESAAAEKGLVLKIYYDRAKYAVTLASSLDFATLTGAGEYYYDAVATIIASEVPGYRFTGWLNKDGESAYNNREASVSVTDNVSLTATYVARTDTPYFVEYYLEKADKSDFELDSVNSSKEEGTTDETVSATSKSIAHFTFDSDNANNITSATVKGDGTTVLKLYYTRDSYTVALTSEKETTISGNGTYVYENGKKVTISAQPVAGYVFLGWFKDGSETAFNTSLSFEYDLTGDITLVAKWDESEDTQYHVYHFLQNLDGTYPETTNTISQYTGTTDTNAQATPSTFDHYEFDEDNAGNVLEGNIAGDGSLVLKVYYKRAKYTVTVDGGEPTEYVYGASVTIETTARAGYTFALKENGVTVSTSYNYSFTIESNKAFVRDWTANTVTYNVEHYLQSVDGSSYQISANDTEVGKEALTDSTVSATPKSIAHFTFDSDNANNVTSATVKGDGTTVLKLYYTRDSYTVSIDVPDIVNELTGDGEHYYNASVSVTMKSVGGFTFDGWYENVDGEETLLSTSANFTLTDHIDRDYEIYSKWTQSVYIGGVQQPISLSEYARNSEAKTDDNIRNEFAYRDNPYYVGDDNAFSIKPVVTFTDADQEDVGTPHSSDYENAWLYNVKLYEKNAFDNYVEVNADLYDDYLDELDRINCNVDFSSDAVGKEFRISIYPSGLTEKQKGKLVEKYSTTIEISVIDGYNVTTAKELAYFNNVGSYTTGKGDITAFDAGARWLAYREEKGLDTKLSPKALILHNDISLTDEDIPSEYFYSEAEVADDTDKEIATGSLKDRMDIFFRYIPEGETFVFEGNYFTLDCSRISLVVRAEGELYNALKLVDSHSQLMRMYSDDSIDSSFGTIRNINLKGNAEKTENTQKSGGLILVKGENVRFEAHNNISNQWYINYMTDFSKKNFKVSYCRAYDSFNCIMYVWGGADVVVDHCDFNGAGGPVFIVDHVHSVNDDITTGTPSCVKVNDSHIHSFVTGEEAWFKMFAGASPLATGIKNIGKAFNVGGRAISVTNSNDSNIEYLDIVAVYKHGKAEGLTTSLVTGYYGTEGATTPMDFGTYAQVAAGNYSDGAKTPLRQVIDGSISKGSFVFVSSDSTLAVTAEKPYPEGVGVFDGATGIVTPALTPLTGVFDGNYYADTSSSIFKGDQMYVYIFNGMSVVLNYYNYGYTVDPTDIGSLIRSLKHG